MGRTTVASPGYLKRHGKPRTPDDLAGHDIVVFNALDGAERWRFRGHDGAVETAVRPRLIVNTGGRSGRCRRVGLWTDARCWLTRRRLPWRQNQSVRVLTEFEPAAVPVHVLYPQGKHPCAEAARVHRSRRAAAATPLRRDRAIVEVDRLHAIRPGDDQRSSHFGVRLSTNAPMPSAASRASMFSTMTDDGIFIGVGELHFSLAIERLLADLHRQRRFRRDLPRQRDRGVALGARRNHAIDQSDALRLLGRRSVRRSAAFPSHACARRCASAPPSASNRTGRYRRPALRTARRAAATARSQLATSWQPAAVATPWTAAITGCGSVTIACIIAAQLSMIRRNRRGRGRDRRGARSVP